MCRTSRRTWSCWTSDCRHRRVPCAAGSVDPSTGGNRRTHGAGAGVRGGRRLGRRRRRLSDQAVPADRADGPAAARICGGRRRCRTTVRVGGRLRLDLAARRAYVDAAELPLRPKEFDLLAALAPGGRNGVRFLAALLLEKGLGYTQTAAGYASTASSSAGFSAPSSWDGSPTSFSPAAGAIAAVCTVALAISLALYGAVRPGTLDPGGRHGAGRVLPLRPRFAHFGCGRTDLGGPLAAATVAGFINGCGSVGAIAQGALVAGVSNRLAGKPCSRH